ASAIGAGSSAAGAAATIGAAASASTAVAAHGRIADEGDAFNEQCPAIDEDRAAQASTATAATATTLAARRSVLAIHTLREAVDQRDVAQGEHHAGGDVEDAPL